MCDKFTADHVKPNYVSPKNQLIDVVMKAISVDQLHKALFKANVCNRFQHPMSIGGRKVVSEN